MTFEYQPPATTTRLYVVYENPEDFPTEFVVRLYDQDADGIQMAHLELHARGGSLDEVRRAIPRGAVNIGRYQNDSPSLREVWIL